MGYKTKMSIFKVLYYSKNNYVSMLTTNKIKLPTIKIRINEKNYLIQPEL